MFLAKTHAWIVYIFFLFFYLIADEWQEGMKRDKENRIGIIDIQKHFQFVSQFLNLTSISWEKGEQARYSVRNRSCIPF